MPLASGVHAKIVQQTLRHSRIDMTLNTYSHVSKKLQREAAKAMDSLFSVPTRKGAIKEYKRQPHR
jgi:integrase